MTEDKGILIKNIFYMLSYAFQDLRKNNYESIATEDFENVDDLFAEIIGRGVSMQLKQGLHKSYVSFQDSLPTLRGKVVMAETFRHKFNGRLFLECEYDEYSADNLFNRILKSTILLLLSSKEVKAERKKLLRRILPFFDDISEIDLRSVKWKSLRFDRNSRSYQILLYLCYFVVQGLLLSTDKGRFTQQLFDEDRMCRLFEKFVLEYYKRWHKEFAPRARHIDWDIDKEQSPGADMLPLLKSDVMLKIGERTLVIDTKYYSKTTQEHFGKSTIKSANLFQIYTYVMNLDRQQGKTDGMLLYAKTGDEIQPNDMVMLSNNNRLYYRNLDLNQDFENIKSQLEEIIATVIA